MSSRDLGLLQPYVFQAANRHMALCAAAGIELVIYCTVRTIEEQAKLFAQGRNKEALIARAARLEAKGLKAEAALLLATEPLPDKRVVTWAGPGESLHQYGRAYDAAPIVNGKIPGFGKVPNDPKLWQQVGELGEKAGLTWAGRWKRPKTETPHFQH